MNNIVLMIIEQKKLCTSRIDNIFLLYRKFSNIRNFPVLWMMKLRFLDFINSMGWQTVKRDTSWISRLENVKNVQKDFTKTKLNKHFVDNALQEHRPNQPEQLLKKIASNGIE